MPRRYSPTKKVSNHARSAFRDPAFAAVVALTIAFVSSATASAWALVYGILLRPLPYPDADRLVTLGEHYSGLQSASDGTLLSNIGYHAWTDAGPSTIGRIALYKTAERTVLARGAPGRVLGAEASGEIGAVLGIAPALGRWFAATASGAIPAEVVLTQGFWRDAFEANPRVLGIALVIDRIPHTVVGVLPDGIAFPTEDVRFLVPFDLRRAEGNGPRPNVLVLPAIARMRPGVSVAAVEAEGTSRLRARGQASVAVRAAFGQGGVPSIRARTLRDAQTQRMRPALVLGAGSVLAIAAIATANLANLFLARATARRRDMAIRRSIGATRSQLIREAAIEILLLATPGVALGIVAAYWALSMLQITLPTGTPRLLDARLDGTAIAVGLIAASIAAGVSVLIGLAGVADARVDTVDALAGRSGGVPPATRRIQRLLLASEAMCAAAVLAFAALLSLSFARLLAVDPGYVPRDVVMARVFVPGDDDASAKRRWRLTGDLLQQIRQLRSVIRAGATNLIPFDSGNVNAGFPVPGEYRRELPPGAMPRVAVARMYAVTPGYAEALRLRLVSGRLFVDGDAHLDRAVWVVNKEFARLYLPPNPIGLRVPWTVDDRDVDLEIVGVVGNVLKDGLDRQVEPEIYTLLRSGIWDDIRIAMRTQQPLTMVANDIRMLVRRLAPDAAVEVTPLEALLDRSTAGPRFLLEAVGLFAGVAVCLACGGLYAMLTFVVTARQRELAIRSAVGAGASAIARIVLYMALAPTAIGGVVGFVSAAFLARLAEDRLFQTSPFEAGPFAISAFVLIATAVLAAAVPAVRAASTDPSAILRSE